MPWSAATGLHQEVSPAALIFSSDACNCMGRACSHARCSASWPWLPAHACHLHVTEQA